MEVAPAENWRLLSRAKQTGAVRTILNLAPACDLDQDGLAAVESCVDVLVVNRQEAAQLAARCGIDLAQAEPAQTARCLAQRFGAVCVATLGADGACAVRGEDVWAVPALRVEVADTTGAGDTFVGVLAAMLDEGRTLPEALRFAGIAASLACRKLGAQASMPGREEIEAGLAQLAGGEAGMERLRREERGRVASFSADDRLSRADVHRRGK
jgi:ribokinase